MSTSSKAFLGHSAVFGLGAILLNVGSIVLLPLYTQYLTPADYGVVDVLTRSGNIIVIGIMANGLRMAALTFFKQAQDREERDAVVGVATYGLFASVAIGIAIAILLSGPIARSFGLGGRGLVILGLSTVLAESLMIVPLVMMQARLESVAYVAATAANFVLKLALSIILVAWCEWGVWGVLIARLATAIVIAVPLNVRELMAARFRWRWSISKDVFRFAVPFIPGGLAAFLLHNGDRFVLLRERGEAEVGLYALCYTIAMAVNTIAVIPFYKVWNVEMYDVYAKPDGAKIAGRVVARILAAFIWVGCGACLMASDVLRVMSDAAYADALATLPILVAAIFLMSIADLLDAAFYVRRVTRYKPIILFVSTGVTLALYLILIPQFARQGAAVATLLGFGVHAALTYVVAQRVRRIDFQWHAVIVMAAAAVALWLIGHDMPSGLGGVAAKFGLWMSWPLIVLATGIVDDDEKRTIRAAIRWCIRLATPAGR